MMNKEWESFYKASYVMNIGVLLTSIVCLVYSRLISQEITWESLSEVNAVSLGISILLVHVFYTVISTKTIWENEIAIQLFGGKYLRVLNPGWRYVPFGICQIIITTRNQIEKDIPGKPEELFYGDTDDTKGVIPEGYIQALYITFAANPRPGSDYEVTLKSGEKKIIPKDDPLLKRLPAQVQGSYGFSVVDLKKLYEVVGDIDSVIARMDDLVISEFRAKLSMVPLAEAKLRLGELAEEIKKSLEKSTENWGVEVKFVGITHIVNSHKFNKALSEAAEAWATKEKLEKESEGKAAGIRNIGQAEADNRYALLSKTAEGEAKRAAIALTPEGRFVIGVEAARDALSKGQTVFVPTDSMFGAIGGINELLKGMTAEKHTDTKPLSKEGGDKKGKE